MMMMYMQALEEGEGAGGSSEFNGPLKGAASEIILLKTIQKE